MKPPFLSLPAGIVPTGVGSRACGARQRSGRPRLAAGGTLLHSLLYPAAATVRALLVAAAGLFLVGCQVAGPATQGLESAEIESLQAAWDGAQGGVDGLEAWGVEGWETARDKSAALDVEEAAQTIKGKRYLAVDDVLVLDENGRPSGGLLADYDAATDAIAARVREFRKAYQAPLKNWENGIRLREHLRRFLEREGIQPEQVEALTEGFAGAIEGGK